MDIAWEAILKIAITAVCLYIIFVVKDILIWFIFAIVLSILFNPTISSLQKKKVPRFLSAALVYVGFFGTVSLFVYLIVPIFVFEIQQFVLAFPQYFDKISPSLRGLGFDAFQDFGNFVYAFKASVEAMGENIFTGLIIFFGGIASTLFVIVTAFFLSLEDKAIEKTLTTLFPKKYESYVLSIFQRCEKKVSGWFVGRLLACLFVGVATYIALLVFRVDYPFTLALFSGVFNFVPFVGPLITAIALFLIIFPAEAMKALFVLAVFALIQQIENQVVSPMLMKKIMGIHPALVIISLAIGGKLWGVIGAIMVVPLVGILFEFMKEFLQKRKEKESVVV